MNLIRIIVRLFIGKRTRRRRPSTHHVNRFETRIEPTLDSSRTGVLQGKCHVIDGDTIVIRRTKIRLAGIDAPELHQPWGQKAKWTMVEICKGQIITAELNGEQSYDRLVATCFLPDGRDIGAELIMRGLALDWTEISGGKYRHLEPRGIRRKLRWARTK